MTFEEARDRVLAQYSGYNRCTETKSAFIFDEDGYDGEGGFGATVVISKESGRLMPFHAAIGKGLLDDEIRTFSIA